MPRLSRVRLDVWAIVALLSFSISANVWAQTAAPVTMGFSDTVSSLPARKASVTARTFGTITSANPQLPPGQIKQATRILGGKDAARTIRLLEELQHSSVQRALIPAVKGLAETSPDSIVRGYARLLAADWNVPIAKRSIQPTLAGATRGQASPLEVNFSSSTDAAAIPTAAQPTHIASTIKVVHPVPASFTPQAPFWAANASFEAAVPTDTVVSERLADFDFQQPDNLEQPDPDLYTLSDASLTAPTPATGLASDDTVRPQILDRPLDAVNDMVLPGAVIQASFLDYARDAPLGYTGKSGVLPAEFQQNDHFIPVEDRWRIGMPRWDRYGNGHPAQDDYPFKEGTLLDPYNQNVLKGDFPIIGQHTFYSLTVESLNINEYRQTPTATTPFESTSRPFSAGFFGSPEQFFYAPYVKFSFDLFHGNEAFKPLDWKLHLMPVVNANNLDVEELAVVNPDVRRGTVRRRDDVALEEWFLEAKLADLGPDYDFVSARVGSQLFVSDFRGFIFRDVNRAARLFGTRHANRDQFNLIWFDQAEKNTNSELNTFDDRHQNITIANYFRQDFIFPGYTAQLSFHYNHDQPSFKFDDNDVLVRPDPVGVYKEHEVKAYYVGFAGDGHIGRINVSNHFYAVVGNDTANPIGGERQSINAQMAAVELSYDRDWIRFRTSYFYASGDDDANDGRAEGFDTILDDPIFAGGEFSYWQRQSIRLFGTNLVQRKSIVPNLRSSKIQGQSNFVNPGLHLVNFGMDFELTPKARVIANANYLFFDHTEVLETYTFQNKIDRGIGTDLSIGVEYRPLLNDNVIVVFGAATLIPDRGLKDLFGSRLPDDLAAIGVGNELADVTPKLTSAFLEVVLAY